MGAIEHLTIPLSAKTANAMRAKVAAGEFADLGALVEAGFVAREIDGPDTDRAWEDEWVRRNVLPALDRYDADPSRGLTVEQVRARLARKEWDTEPESC